MTKLPRKFEDLEPLIHDAVNAGRLLEMAIDSAMNRGCPGVPEGMAACTTEDHDTILFALNTLNRALQLSEEGFRSAHAVVQEQGSVRSAA